MLRASGGTLCALGLKKTAGPVLPTTAYLMLGTKCRRNCLFCAQRRDAPPSVMLSRVDFPPVEWEAVLEGLRRSSLERICFQLVCQEGVLRETEKGLALLRQHGVRLPVCVSYLFRREERVRRLLALGAERVSLPLDAAPSVFAGVKGEEPFAPYRFVLQMARRYPGRIGTHLIFGLGESEEEFLGVYQKMVDGGVTVGLFAFTPLKNTPLADRDPPPLGRYRVVQALTYLMEKGRLGLHDVVFAGGRVRGLKKDRPEVLALLEDGAAFRTRGCPGCNRPYFNESPRGPLYNYPRELTEEEAKEALAVLERELEFRCTRFF